MSLRISELGPASLELNVLGTIEAEDAERFTALAQPRIRELGKLNLVVNLSEFSADSPAGFWRALKLDDRHYNDILRLAVVDEDTTKPWMATWLAVLAGPLTSAEVQYYCERELETARRWVTGTTQ